MNLAKTVMAAIAALTVIGSAAFAQQALTGTVTRVDRISGTVSIQQTQGGTVGSAGAAAEEFKVQDGTWLNTLHAGDRIGFSASESGKPRTITKLEKR